jgi:hypothetical protein
MPKDNLNLRESSCPICNSVVFIYDLTVLADSYTFDLKCCGVGCGFNKHVERKRRDRQT